jgi:hypothetical protein
MVHDADNNAQEGARHQLRFQSERPYQGILLKLPKKCIKCNLKQTKEVLQAAD